ncbi:MAG: ferredoxin-type protein NapF [Pseudomonas marincola]
MENEQTSVSRRAFLRGGKLNRQNIAPLPHLPWAAPETILNACSQCDECQDACLENIIVKNKDGFPTVDFSNGACTFCSDCVKICPEPVFDLTAINPQSAWNLKAVIADDCLAKNAVQCQSCQDHCEVQAIGFHYVTSAIPTPVISLEDCTGCGACVSICPSSSIAVIPQTAINLPKGPSL